MMSAEPELVLIAGLARRGEVGARAVFEAWGRSYLYARTSPEAPTLHVADLGDRGRWASVFSTRERLAHAHGECEAIGMPGADYLEHTPSGVGLLLDPGTPHTFPLPAHLLDQAAAALGVSRA
ncbi:SseB family protein [Saccharopolyspora sp. 6M]|uniref:SseB family protein n=1 Tax=Saccharopolyspora sp. 6M TaxID=2877237 RepID=UPI001CD674BC|nr:SseB family protein [Saccharopolyspora sp. 6M]MCA1229400.1 SseB family protein [Saccharopolyspora sp. 6M]